MSAGEWVSLALSASVAATGGYWWARLRRLLPLERALEQDKRRLNDQCSFALELLQIDRLPATPQSFCDMVQAGVDRFLARFGGLDVFVWMRMSSLGAFRETPGELVCRTGLLEALEPRDMELSQDVVEEAFRVRDQRDWSARAPAAFTSMFGAKGFTMRLIPWGTPGKLWGVLGILEGGAVRNGGPAFWQGSESLAAFLGSLADRCVRFWELDRAREQLEGGLSATMRRLDETSLQLIQKAKEMRTVAEVMDAISEHPDQPEILRAIVAMVAKGLEADLCAFLLLDEATGELVVQPGGYGLAEDEGSLYRISLANEGSSSVRVFRTGVPFITGDAQNDPQVIPRFARMWKCHSLMVVPLSIEGRRIGVMRVGSFKRDFFLPEHVQFVRLIAEEAAVLVDSAILSKKLSETNVQLTQLHHLKDDFVSTVSHEFKTPLTSIKGFLAILLEGDAGPLTAEQRRFLGIAMSASDRLSQLVSDMLDISKLEGGLEIEFASLRLEEVARLSVEAHSFVAEERQVHVDLEEPPGALPQVQGNAEWLRHVFDNLISNSLKFTPKGGRVTVSLANKGVCVMASVADTGIGIPAKDLDHVFEKFYQASNRQAVLATGTGLGLAICHTILERHEGRIWVESEEGKGTRFHFMVPAARAESPRKAASRRAEASQGNIFGSGGV